MSALYEPQPDDCLFSHTKYYSRQQMLKGCKAAGMEPIRLHDFRHSHAALLIQLNTPILLVSKRLSHEDIETPLRICGTCTPPQTTKLSKNWMISCGNAKVMPWAKKKAPTRTKSLW